MRYIPLFLLLISLMGGCASSHRLSESVHQQDSVQIKVETRIEYVTDTVYIDIPAQTAERETADSTSHLENDYATSDARINHDGTLFHSLKTKPQKKPVGFEKPIEHKDSIIYKTKTVTEVRTLKVPRQLNWWEKTQIYGFWVVLFILVIVHRKKILSLLKVLI